MRYQEGFMNGNSSVRIYHQCWLPEDKPKALLLVVHGLGEHSGRYMNLVNHFVPGGYAVYGFDHPGHGKSDGPRVYVTRFQDYIVTLKAYVGLVAHTHPDIPIYLVGHSMGGLIAAAYLLEHQNEVTGAVLSGPGIKVPDNISRAVIFIGKILSILMPRAGIIQLDANGVSSDPEVVSAYIHDPLVHSGKVTARLGAEMLKTMQVVTQQASDITLPIMIVQGGADLLVDPDGAQQLYDSVGSTDKTLIVYDGFYHEVFNEPDHAKVLDDVAQWLGNHLDDDQ